MLSHCQAMPHVQDCPSTPVGPHKRCLQGEGWEVPPPDPPEGSNDPSPASLTASLSLQAGHYCELLLAPVAANGIGRYFSTASLNLRRTTSEIAQSLLPNSGHPLKTASYTVGKRGFSGTSFS